MRNLMIKGRAWNYSHIDGIIRVISPKKKAITFESSDFQYADGRINFTNLRKHIEKTHAT